MTLSISKPAEKPLSITTVISEIFPVLKRMLERILGESPIPSQQTWNVNMVGFAITDDEAAVEASKQEIIRRYYQTVLDFKAEKVGETAVKKIEPHERPRHHTCRP